MLNATQFQNISQDSKRRLCKFTTTWCLFKEFQSWLVPVKYQNQKAYCILCRRVFSVSHSGLHDVKAHWKGKKHLQLQEQELEKNTEESTDSNEIKAYMYTFNEEVRNIFYILVIFNKNNGLRTGPDVNIRAKARKSVLIQPYRVFFFVNLLYLSLNDYFTNIEVINLG